MIESKIIGEMHQNSISERIKEKENEANKFFDN